MTHCFFRLFSTLKTLIADIALHNIIALLLASSGLCLTSLASAQTTFEAAKANPSPITIEANEFLEWNQTEGTYTAKGNAFVQQDQANITAAQIVAYYNIDGETRNIYRVIATGEVTYIEGQNTAKGERLDYDLISRTYVLTGKKASIAGPRGVVSATKSIKYNAKDDAKRMVTAIGKAHFRNSDGRNIFGDKLIAYIGIDGRLDTLKGYANTKVITAEGTAATADKLNYTSDTSVAKLDGNVEIIDKDNIMRGARAVIDFKKEISRIISNPGGQRVSGTLTP